MTDKRELMDRYTSKGIKLYRINKLYIYITLIDIYISKLHVYS